VPVAAGDIDRAPVDEPQRDCRTWSADQTRQLRIFGDVSGIALFGGRIGRQLTGGASGAA